jgi:hypothetical protein
MRQIEVEMQRSRAQPEGSSPRGNQRQAPFGNGLLVMLDGTLAIYLAMSYGNSFFPAQVYREEGEGFQRVTIYPISGELPSRGRNMSSPRKDTGCLVA